MADVLTLAPYPSIKEYRPMNDPVSKEYLIISIWFLSFEPNKPRSIIPKQINKIEIKVVILNTTPRNIIEINVANNGPKPLNIGYTFV